MKKTAFFLIFLLGLSRASLFAAPAETAAPEHSARTIVNLLDYLAQDYGGAVKGGKIVNADEYKEHLEFARTIVNLTGKFSNETKSTGESARLNEMAEKFDRLIREKAPEGEVASRARQLQTLVLAISGLEQSPSRWPSPSNGKKLFAQNCATCHGAAGRGDGPAAASLTPKPLNFLEDERMPNLSPFQSFNAIRVGLPGTGMAANNQLSDKEVWDLAFYVISLRHNARAERNTRAESSTRAERAHDQTPDGLQFNAQTLKLAATLGDVGLEPNLPGPDKKAQLVAVRQHEETEQTPAASIDFARASLREALTEYSAGNADAAKKKALLAYLEGVEPVEPRLKANDPRFMVELEGKMAAVRAAIERKASRQEIKAAVAEADAALAKTAGILAENASSPWLTFTLAAGILLREGFEAVLLLIALLGVIRASHSRKAEHWLHGGWIAAVVLGYASWVFSDWLTGITGAQRELMEGLTSLLAVTVLLYIGFWLHSRTEITRWKAFIDGKVQTALEGGNLFGIATIAFIAVFREAFETVLFLRAVSLESQSGSSFAMGAGVLSAFGLILILAWMLLRYSEHVPIRKLFTISSALMIALAVILTGKAFHSLQETGLLTITSAPLNLRVDLVGVYPTLETLLTQTVILALSLVLWQLGKRPPRKT